MPSSVISSQSMHLGVLATASHVVATRTLFVEFNKPGTSQFIVGLNKYLEAVNNCFGVGMRFKMRFEGEDSPERRFTGTIVGVEDLSSQWENLKWRSLKVQWDDAASIARPERVFPWEIEPFVPFASNKRPRPPPNEVPIHETASAAASAVCIYGKWEELYNPDNHIALLSVKIWKNLYTFKVELFTLQAMQNGIATGSELIKTNIALNGNELADVAKKPEVFFAKEY